jgi:hypothetical protein
VQELAYFGYDGVVLGRNLAEVVTLYLWKLASAVKNA